jgi:hypothetical protein
VGTLTSRNSTNHSLVSGPKLINLIFIILLTIWPARVELSHRNLVYGSRPRPRQLFSSAEKPSSSFTRLPRYVVRHRHDSRCRRDSLSHTLTTQSTGRSSTTDGTKQTRAYSTPHFSSWLAMIVIIRSRSDGFHFFAVSSLFWQTRDVWQWDHDTWLLRDNPCRGIWGEDGNASLKSHVMGFDLFVFILT